MVDTLAYLKERDSVTPKDLDDHREQRAVLMLSQ
jgi:hypothetical protein